MRRKFVQIAAIFLTLSILSTSFAAAVSGEDSNAQQNSQVGITEDENSIQEATELGDSESNSEQDATEAGDEETDPEQDSTEAGDEETDPEQDSTEAGDEETDPEEGTTDPEVPEIIIPVLETEEETEDLLRIGLSYGSNAQTSSNLWNAVGTGYRFGFHDGTVFYQVGNTSETRISVLNTQNLYYTSVMPDGYSGYGASVTSGPAVGCVHLQLPGTYTTFAQANAAAAAVGGFPAWINGEFVVRYGTFLTADDARKTQAVKGFVDASVVGTSEYGLIIVITGTNTPLFQYDGGSDYPMLVIKPGLDPDVKSITHCKGIQYYGSFRYERIGGGSITVVNLVDIDDYVRGVIPYEMSPSWPLEALKAQAVAARSYAVALNNPSHSKNGFDVCTTECCQVYSGTGGATAHTDQAVDETAGQYAWYDGKPILAVFTSSDGGATESCENVWFEALPYLRGVMDPYEALVAEKINSYNWTKAYTGVQLKDKLNGMGYQCSEIVDVIFKNTDTGNVYSLTFVDTNGRNWTFSKDSLRITFGFKSLRFSLADDGIDYTLTDQTTLDSLHDIWTLNGDGELVQLSATPVYALTSQGVVEVPGSEMTGRTFVFNGTGRGHNLGMSQWGAYAMAQQGFTYDQILKFYYTGIEIHE